MRVNISTKKRKIALRSLAAFMLLLIGAGIMARAYPEAFIRTGVGRAVGSRLMRVGFIRAYVARRPEILINPRTVGIMLRETGMDDIDRFRDQLEAGRESLSWSSLSPERKSRYFEGLYDPERLPYTIGFIMSMPEEHRREVVDFVAGHAREYRMNMTPEEAEVLSARINSPEGRRVLADSQRYYLTRLTPEQMQAIGPVVDEIVILAARMLR